MVLEKLNGVISGKIVELRGRCTLLDGLFSNRLVFIELLEEAKEPFRPEEEECNCRDGRDWCEGKCVYDCNDDEYNNRDNLQLCTLFHSIIPPQYTLL